MIICGLLIVNGNQWMQIGTTVQYGFSGFDDLIMKLKLKNLEVFRSSALYAGLSVACSGVK